MTNYGEAIKSYDKKKSKSSNKDYYYKYKALKYYLKNKQIKGGIHKIAQKFENLTIDTNELHNLTIGQLDENNDEHISIIDPLFEYVLSQDVKDYVKKIYMIQENLPFANYMVIFLKQYFDNNLNIHDNLNYIQKEITIFLNKKYSDL